MLIKSLVTQNGFDTIAVPITGIGIVIEILVQMFYKIIEFKLS